MTQTTPDIRQLSTCCGKVLVWDQRRCEDPDCGCVGWDATCPMCGCLQCDGMPDAERQTTPTEDLIMARITTLEAENAELRATLANERGEGEPPCEGWRYHPAEGKWRSASAVVYHIPWLRMPDGSGKSCYGWERWDSDVLRGRADTARDAMRAASGVDNG